MVVETIVEIVVIGSTGQLGTELMNVFEGSAVGLTHKDIDVCKPDTFEVIKKIKPKIIINTAAYVNVKLAETDVENVFRVNAIGALNIAKLCKEIGAINVYISTDYVFDGKKNKPYTEEDVPNPLNVYGASKCMGDLFTKNYSKNYYIIRSASLFGKAGSSGKGGNFIETIISKAKNKEKIEVVDDMFMSPTYAVDAAMAIKKLIDINAQTGIYNVNNAGQCSWFEFAKNVFDLLDIQPNLKSSKTDDTSIRRPLYSVLDNNKLRKLDISMDTWQNALKRYLEEKKHLGEKNAV